MKTVDDLKTYMNTDDYKRQFSNQHYASPEGIDRQIEGQEGPLALIFYMDTVNQGISAFEIKKLIVELDTQVLHDTQVAYLAYRIQEKKEKFRLTEDGMGIVFQSTELGDETYLIPEVTRISQ